MRSKLQSRQVTIGSWISLAHSAIAEIFARTGFDWLVVDLEHSTISIDQAGELIRVIDLAGCTPLVRLTSNNPDQIKRIMDAGAHGIVVPMVKSAEDARSAVEATRYAPEGVRGVGLARAQGYGESFKKYLEWQKEEGPIVIVQIEHHEAVRNMDDILKVSGVDGYFIGPYDLSCSMGIPGDFNHPEFEVMMKRIQSIGMNSGCPGGIHIVEPDLGALSRAIADGYTIIAYSVDIRMLAVTATQWKEVVSG